MAKKILRTFQDKSTKLWGCKDKDGNIVIAPEWNWIAEANGSADFQNGLCAVKKKEGKKKAMFGYINVAGELVIPCKYDAAESFKEGMAIVKKGEKYFMIDKAGEKKSNEYDIIFHCEEGMRLVTLPENITEIPTGCFYDYRNLCRIVLPSSVTKVAKDAFHYCKNLDEVVSSESIEHIDMFDGGKEWIINTVKQ